VNATPVDSSIKIMNIVPPYRPGIALSPGAYDILVTRPGYQPFRQWVDIRDHDLSVAVDLENSLEVAQKQEVRVHPDAVGSVERRTALVIGNAAYPNAPLRHPVNDATDLAAALERLDFNVTLLRNATYQEMDTAVDNFSLQLRRGGVGVLYYAGHGIQREGENYLIPVDARLQEEVDVRYQAVNARWALERMEDAGNELNIVILDACRTNAFVRSWRSSRQGLAVMQAAQGALIVYATEPGGVVLDGDQRNSIYTRHLLRHIETVGLPVEQLFKQVRLDVYQETDTKQLPWESSSLTGDFYFVPERAAN
jgi:uncharacterized caspase-like protein